MPMSILGLYQSGIIRVAALSLGAAFISPAFGVATALYAILDRVKIINELAILYLNLRYSLPDHSSRDGNYYQANESHYLDPIAQFDDATVFVGGIPHKHHAEWLKEKNCSVVISLVETHEYDVPKCIANLMQPQDWEEMDISFHHYETPDHTAIAPEDLDLATNVAIAAFQNGKSTYIHCRAGRGRSAELATHIIHRVANKTLDESFEIIRNARPNVVRNF